jgi:two-component system, LytTR family, response regulator
VFTKNAQSIRTLIADDEPLARSNIAILLGSDPEIEVIGGCGTGRDALAAIRTAKPDLVFLDVQMPEFDGFDVLEQLGRDLPPAIVFVTAYDQYALRAFDAGALDYLLKPFDNTRFERALTRAKDRIRYSTPALKAEHLVVKNAGQITFLKFSEIDWIEAADYYACLHVGRKTFLLRRTLSELEQELNPNLFCRIHRSTIVNIARVKSLKLNQDGEYDVGLEDGTRLRLSRRYRRELQHRLGLRTPIRA